jgi:hypothetical protein
MNTKAQRTNFNYVFCYGLHLSSPVYNSFAVLYVTLPNKRSLSMPDLNFSTTFFPPCASTRVAPSAGSGRPWGNGHGWRQALREARVLSAKRKLFASRPLVRCNRSHAAGDNRRQSLLRRWKAVCSIVILRSWIPCDILTITLTTYISYEVHLFRHGTSGSCECHVWNNEKVSNGMNKLPLW